MKLNTCRYQRCEDWGIGRAESKNCVVIRFLINTYIYIYMYVKIVHNF